MRMWTNRTATPTLAGEDDHAGRKEFQRRPGLLLYCWYAGSG
jgi:hypothetical protein